MIALLVRMFPTFLKYRRWIAFGFFVLCIPMSYGWGYWAGYVAKARNVEIKALVKTITVREKLNEIRNNRPDDAELIDSLRHGKF